MKTPIALIILLLIGFLGSKGWVARVRSKSFVAPLFVSGIEFFLLGVLFGPSFLNVMSPAIQDTLRPIVYLALGWIGLMFGAQLSRRQLEKVSTAVFKLIAADVFLFTITFAAVSWFFLRLSAAGSSRYEILEAGVLLAVTAFVSSPTLIGVQAKRIPASGAFTTTVRMIASLQAIAPLFLFGFLFMAAHSVSDSGMGWKYEILWWLFANAFGVVLGFVMVLLSAQRCPENERVLLMMGMLMLVGGFCYFFRLSLLYTSMLMGIVVGNFSKRREEIFKQLVQFDKTIYIMFLFMVGAMVKFDSPGLAQTVVFYVVLRLALKTLFTRELLKRYFPGLNSAGLAGGLVFSAQGGMVLAMVLDFLVSNESALIDMIASSIVLAVVVNEITGFFLTGSALRASGEARTPSRAPAGGAP
jgi:Kef-type K+ transport system membrane component KefB